MHRPFLAAVLVYVGFLAVRADQTGDYSPSVNGLRGRLIILEPASPDPFLTVKLELQNVLNLMGDRHLAFGRSTIIGQVSDETGKVLALPPSSYDDLSAIHDFLVLPFDSSLTFPINGHGLGIFPSTKKVIDLGPMSSWVIPVNDGHTYFLSGKFTIDKKPRDHPTLDWSGTLELPKVRIP